MVLIGAHVDPDDPIAAADERGADVIQFFLADPQGWRAPEPHPQAERIHQAALEVVVHAPYVINVASPNNRIRIPSRKLLDQHATAAATVGARGLVVHGGHVTAGTDPADGVANWRKALERADHPVPILIENTAGGEHAMARHLDQLARLWDAIGEFGVGFCLDTCHAHAAGVELDTVVDRVRAITGRIDLVHLNNSRDPFGSGRDRHANLRAGTIDPEPLLAVAAAAGAPIICETPGGVAGQRADIELVRDSLAR